MTLVERLLREPLLHFFLIGALFFLVFEVMSEKAPEPVDTILVGPDTIQRLTAGYQSVWKRPPSADELRALIDEHIREEIYYREALALGLDSNDAVVRRRLRQKMEFLTDTGGDLLQPAAGELEAYFSANAEAYQFDPRLAFVQIYLGEDPSSEDLQGAFDALRSDPAKDPETLGRSSLLAGELPLSPPSMIDALFGTGFFELLAALPSDEWSGPIASAYGKHLVRILDRQPAYGPPLAKVRAAVLRDWKTQKVLDLREAQYARLRKRYDIQILDETVPLADGR